ncbi:MAG: hypothetical protein H8D23_38470 [Candidatus Brocadiales bacterium]|nr:hypothetical protein [Candidatus Brocadiales bacterium]
MKKLTIAFCLMLLCVVLFNSRVDASFIYNIDLFEQNAFLDDFNDDVEPTSPPYDLYDTASGAFPDGRESGGVLQLNSDDGIGPLGKRMIAVSLDDSRYNFTVDNGGLLRCNFNYSSGSLQNDSGFGIVISNWPPDSDTGPDSQDRAEIGVVTSPDGSIHLVWGDETTGPGKGSLNLGEQLFTGGAFTRVEIKINISDTMVGSQYMVSGSWKFFNGGTVPVFSFTKSNFTGLTFNSTNGTPDDYTGGFFAGEPASGAAPDPGPDPLAVPVDLDIKPGTCPNPLNIKSKGVLPVAILGTSDFDVNTIDVSSITLNGVEPIRSAYENVAGPTNSCECTETSSADGIEDLVLKFDTQAIVATLGDVEDGAKITLTLGGSLLEEAGTEIEGSDCILILDRGKKK